MKKQFLTIAIVLLTITTTLFVGCKKDILGCMDTSSTNYNPDATKDDGSCKYSGKVVYWWKSAFADSCAANGITTLKIYLDGTFEGALPVSSQSWTSAPDCGASATITASVDMGSSKTKTVVEKTEFYVGTILYGSVTTNFSMNANTCNTNEETW